MKTESDDLQLNKTRSINLLRFLLCQLCWLPTLRVILVVAFQHFHNVLKHSEMKCNAVYFSHQLH